MICKKCNKEFKTRGYIDGIYRNFKSRKYCLECSPFNSGNTKKLEMITEEDLQREKVCSVCGNKYIYNIKKGHRKSVCSGCYSRKYRLKIKEKAVNYLGGRCTICGYKKCIKALEFHHKNPYEKEFSISMKNGCSWDVLKKELDKCTLLCSNCHREKHYL